MITRAVGYVPPQNVVIAVNEQVQVDTEMGVRLSGLTHDLRFFYAPNHLLLPYKYNV